MNCQEIIIVIKGYFCCWNQLETKPLLLQAVSHLHEPGVQRLDPPGDPHHPQLPGLQEAEEVLPDRELPHEEAVSAGEGGDAGQGELLDSAG